MNTNIVFIFDEDLGSAGNLKEYLSSIGYLCVVNSSNNLEAFNPTIDAAPNLILVDINYGGQLKGIEFAKNYVEENECAVIYLTVDSNQTILDLSKSTDPYAFLLKPINQKELKIAVEMAIFKHNAKKQLAESEERYRIISQITSDYAYCASIDNDDNVEINWSTPGFEEEMGYSIASLVGKETWKTHVYHKDYSAIENAVNLLLTGVEVKTEARFIKSNNQLLWFSICLTPVYDEKHKRIIKYYGALQNINLRKDAELQLQQINDELEIRVQERTSQLEAAVESLQLEIAQRIESDSKLKESQDRHRVFIETSTEGISRVEIDPPIPLSYSCEQRAEHYYEHAYLAECNATFAKMYGFDNPSELIGRSFKSFYSDDKQTVINSMMHLFNDDLKVTDFESKELDKDGNIVYFLNNATMLTKDNCIYQLWGSQRDITDTKKRSKQIQLQAKLLNSVSDSIFLIDQQGKIIYSNEIGYTSRGYSKIEFENFPIELLNEESNRSKVKSRIDRIFEKGFIFFETIHVRKDGTTFPVEINGQLVELENEKFILSVNRDISERKKHLEQLNQSEAKYKLIAENTKDIIWTCTLDLKISYISPSIKTITGFTQEEILNANLSNILTPESFNKAMAKYRDVFELEKENQVPDDFSISIELDQFCKDGSLIPTESVLSLIRDEKGTPVAIIGITRDISERKKTERAIKQSEEKFSKAFYTSPDAVSISRLQDGVYLEINTGFAELTGYRPEEIIGHSSLELSIWNNLEDRKRFIDELMLSGKVENFSSQFRLKNGIIKTGLMSAQLIELGGSTCILNIVRDVTKIKRAEEEIYRLSRAIEHSPAAIIITDNKGVIEYVNPKFSEITGYSALEAVGKTPRILKSGKQSPELYKNLWSTILAGNEWRGEMHNKKKNGELYWEYDSISSIKDEQGNIKSFLAIKEDISEQKRLLNDIIKAKEEAEEANKVKSSLLANMSHEFRTPLNGILGFAQLLKEEIKDDANIEMVEKINSSGRRLMNTLNGVLTLTELENEDYLIQQNEIDLTFFCQQTKTLFESAASSKGLKLSADLPDDEIIVHTDENLLTKIVTNIIDNAFKYTHQGEVKIQLSKYNDSNFPNSVVIKIIDTGIGIKKEDQPIIFREFRQLSEGFRRDYEGLGIGLTLSKRMATLIGIDIAIESQVGIGSQFSIIIPYKNPKLESLPAELKASENILETPLLPKEERKLEILIVEDNPLNIEVVQRFLSKKGRVFAARDGETALVMIENNFYDLLLIDINLGHGIDGIEVLNQVRKLERYQSTPVIALTGYASEMHKRDFLKHGFTGYLPKPFEKKMLLQLVEEIT